MRKKTRKNEKCKKHPQNKWGQKWGQKRGQTKSKKNVLKLNKTSLNKNNSKSEENLTLLIGEKKGEEKGEKPKVKKILSKKMIR